MNLATLRAGLFFHNQAVEQMHDAIGMLKEIEMIEWNARDLARGRMCIAPARGTVAGITPAGELRVALADSVARFRSGSLVLDPKT